MWHTEPVDIEGINLAALRSFPPDEVDALLAFGRPITFRMGSATILAEFNDNGPDLAVNLAHVDGGGEGVLVRLWKLIESYAAERGYTGVLWNIHALTCAKPNPRLRQFLDGQGFEEVASEQHGRVLSKRQAL